MDREKFIENKQSEIREEVDFLRKEKYNAYGESAKLYEEIRNKITDLKYCVRKEDLANKRLELIDKSGSQIYGVHVDSILGIPYSINRSLINLNSLAKSKFGIEEFGGLLEEKNKTDMGYVNTQKRK